MSCLLRTSHCCTQLVKAAHQFFVRTLSVCVLSRLLKTSRCRPQHVQAAVDAILPLRTALALRTLARVQERFLPRVSTALRRCVWPRMQRPITVISNGSMSRRSRAAVIFAWMKGAFLCLAAHFTMASCSAKVRCGAMAAMTTVRQSKIALNFIPTTAYQA